MTNMRTFDVEVIQVVRVTLDASKFDEVFMTEFRESFYPFFDLEDHAKHIAQLAAREIYSLNPHIPHEFVEGYGPIGAMGISADVREGREELIGGTP